MSSFLSAFLSFVVALNLLLPAFAVTAASTTSTDESSKQQNWIKNNRNGIKDTKRELDEIKRDAKNANFTTINELVNKYEACLTAREGQLGTDAFWNSTRDCEDISGLIDDELTDNLRPLRDCVSIKRSIDDRKKEKKNQVDRQMKDIQRDDKSADLSGLQEIIVDMDEAFKTADELLADQCSEEVRDELNDIQSDLSDYFQDFYDQAEEVSPSINNQKESNQNARDLTQQEEQGQNAIKDIEQRKKETSQKQKEQDQQQISFDEISTAPPPDKEFYKDYFEKNVGFEKDTMNSAADILTRVSQEIVERVFQKMISDPSMVENLLKVAGNRYKDAAAGTLESVTSFYTDEATQRDLFEKKTQFLELNQQLSDLQSQIQVAKEKLDDLERIQNEIASYNFFGSAGETIRADIVNFIEEAKDKGLSKDEIRAKIDALTAKKDAAIQESKQAKLDAGIIPFKDADDNEWFTKFAIRVKQKGWIQGTGTSGGTEMNPSGITNVAEAIMMFARVEGIDEGAEPISGVGKKLPDWAQAAAGTLDEAGVALDDIFGGKNPGDSVSRGEVARLLVQVLDLPAADVASASVFTDMKLANADEKAAIAAVNTAGIMTGQGGAGPKVFDVKGPLNRAALVKILDLASSMVQGQ